MSLRKAWAPLFHAVLVTLCLGMGFSNFATELPDGLKITAGGWFDYGSIVSSSNTGQSEDDEYARNWLNTAGAWLMLDKNITERVALHTWTNILFTYPVILRATDAQNRGKWNVGVVGAANITFTAGDLDAPPLQLKMGYFPYKYNKYARNLGEYLLRSLPYPTTVFTAFEEPWHYMLGFQIHSKLGLYTQDLLIRSETEKPPYYDFSFSYVGSLNFGDVLEIGGGVDLYHLLPANKEITTRWLSTKDKGENYNPQNDYLSQYVLTEDNDTLPITSKGIKAMVRGSFDPKPLISTDLFGENDLVLYGEAAILGIKDYPVYYENKIDRMPIAFGINVPTFRLLDILNFELEIFRSPYENDYSPLAQNNDALPLYPESQVDGVFIPFVQDSSFDASKDDIKWSVYAKKTILDGKIGFTAQVASDHLQPVSHVLKPVFQDALITPTDIYWIFRTSFMF